MSERSRKIDRHSIASGFARMSSWTSPRSTSPKPSFRDTDSFSVMLAPTALNRLGPSDGELASRGGCAAGTVMTLHDGLVDHRRCAAAASARSGFSCTSIATAPSRAHSSSGLSERVPRVDGHSRYAADGPPRARHAQPFVLRQISRCEPRDRGTNGCGGVGSDSSFAEYWRNPARPFAHVGRRSAG